MVERKPVASLYLDDNGVPVSVYGTIAGQHIGAQRSIVAVAEKGLDYWARLKPQRPAPILSYSWESGRDLRTAGGLVSSVEDHAGMVNCAQWLLSNVDSQPCYAVWRYAYPSFYGTRAGWRCAHAQGQAIRLLLRTYEITGDERYLDCVRLAVNGFSILVEQGGITEKLTETQWWYHKFADENCQKPRVLNGMMFALLGLYDAHLSLRQSAALDLFEYGLEALVSTISVYDQEKWSAYNVFGQPASQHYHDIHCRQLEQLTEISPRVDLTEVLARWRQGDTAGATGGKWEARSK